MIPKVEHIGQNVTWAQRVRRFFAELFGSRYCALLERELIQLRVERERALAELKATQDRLVLVLSEMKGVRMQEPIPFQPMKSAVLGPTKWEQIYAKAIEDNAKAEAAEEKAKGEAKEN